MNINRVEINRDKCKGCKLCISECKPHIIELSDDINALGYYPAQITDMDKCTGCKICAISCPDAVISVFREGD